MLANINPDTGIAYGVVSMNLLNSWAWDEFEQNGTNDSYNEAAKELKAEFFGDCESIPPDVIEDLWDNYCDTITEGIQTIDEPTYSLTTDDGMSLGISWLGGAPMVWIFESPHVAYVSPCSPCCPNAGDIQSAGNSGTEAVHAYTLPTEWFGND